MHAKQIDKYQYDNKISFLLEGKLLIPLYTKVEAKDVWKMFNNKQFRRKTRITF